MKQSRYITANRRFNVYTSIICHSFHKLIIDTDIAGVVNEFDDNKKKLEKHSVWLEL